jgi:hypothetical protein
MVAPEADGGETRTYTLLGPDARLYNNVTPGTLGGHPRGQLYEWAGTDQRRCGVIARGDYVEQAVLARAVAVGYRPCAACLPTGPYPIL